MSESSSGSGGIGFAGLLTVAFVVLKLCGVIGWSWWWVLSPIWISLIVVVVIVAVPVSVMLAVAVFAAVIAYWREKRSP